jgi:hypothetical protein
MNPETQKAESGVRGGEIGDAGTAVDGPGSIAKDAGHGKTTNHGLRAMGRRVVVRCAGFLRLAYRDQDGKWCDMARNEELPEVLEVLWG